MNEWINKLINKDAVCKLVYAGKEAVWKTCPSLSELKFVFAPDFDFEV